MENIEYRELYSKAVDFAIRKHQGKYDSGGMPYILHPLYVANKFNDYETKIVAVLHDIIEKTNASIVDLLWMGLPQELIMDIVVLSRKPRDSYFDHIKEVLINERAMVVKIEEIKHNLDWERIVDEEVRYSVRAKKEREYFLALELLEENLLRITDDSFKSIVAPPQKAEIKSFGDWFGQDELRNLLKRR